MIQIKTSHEIDQMRLACQISQEALMAGGAAVKPGATTWDIDKVIYDYIVHHGAKPNFKGLYGFPGTACISVNDVVIHGIPSKKVVLKEGDIVSIDVGAYIGEYMDELCQRVDDKNPFGDCARDYLYPCHYKKEASAAGAAIFFIDEFLADI